jgi:hypothetical protein
VKGPFSRRLGALVVCASTLLLSGFSLGSRRQLGHLGGLTDEWYPLGLNLLLYGTLGVGSEPSLLRPPGYPAFVAGLVGLAAPKPVETSEYARRVRGVVYAAHALVLATAAVLLYLWLSTWLRPPCALAGALFLGLNPISLVLAGLLHYSLLHVLGLVAGLCALDWATQGPPRAVRHACSGALFGLVSLVRPVTLPLPVFAVAPLLAQAGRSRVLRSVAFFAAGMAMTIAPWTARNLAHSGRLVPVNQQASMAFWAATEKPLPWDAEHYLWFELADEQLRIYSRVTGQPEYDFFTFLRYLPRLEEEYASAALANLGDRPSVYIGNVARSLFGILAQTGTALPRAFVRFQRSPELAEVPRGWFARAESDSLEETAFAAALRVLFGGLTLMAARGLLLGALERDRRLLGPAAVFGCVAVAHALTHYDLMYQYLRLPFLSVFAFYSPRGPGRPGLADAGGRSRWEAVCLVMAGLSVALSLWMLGAS